MMRGRAQGCRHGEEPGSCLFGGVLGGVAAPRAAQAVPGEEGELGVSVLLSKHEAEGEQARREGRHPTRFPSWVRAGAGRAPEGGQQGPEGVPGRTTGPRFSPRRSAPFFPPSRERKGEEKRYFSRQTRAAAGGDAPSARPPGSGNFFLGGGSAPPRRLPDAVDVLDGVADFSPQVLLVEFHLGGREARR